MTKYNPSDWQITANGGNVDALHKSGLKFLGTLSAFNTLISTTNIFTPEDQAERNRLSALGVILGEVEPLTGMIEILAGESMIVIADAAPDDNDGRPVGTLYFQRQP